METRIEELEQRLEAKEQRLQHATVRLEELPRLQATVQQLQHELADSQADTMVAETGLARANARAASVQHAHQEALEVAKRNGAEDKAAVRLL